MDKEKVFDLNLGVNNAPVSTCPLPHFIENFVTALQILQATT